MFRTPQSREKPAPGLRHLLLAGAAAALLAAPGSAAITIDWGSVFPTSVVTSTGAVVPSEGFYFEIGVFNTGFTPEQTNRDEWFDNWVIFDGIGPDAPDDVDIDNNPKYNPGFGYFTSTADFLNTGESGSGYSLADNTHNFAGLEAWLWIRNDTQMVSGSEWLLVRSTDWVFPATFDEGNSNQFPPEEWSISQLSESDVPLYGRHGNVVGPGERTANPTGPPFGAGPSSQYLLQLYTIPEPSGALLTTLALTLALLSRRRR